MNICVLLIAGLPGSGKTTYLRELEGSGRRCFDDFKNDAIGNSRLFCRSQHYAALLASSRAGLRCAVTDIDFCRTESRLEAANVLIAEAPRVEIAWLYFSHDVQACAANIRRRARPSLQEDLRELSRYSSCYDIPEGAEQRLCHSMAAGSDKRPFRG